MMKKITRYMSIHRFHRNTASHWRYADVTSRYTRRNRTEYRKILDYIRQAAEARKGNYIVFFHPINT